MLVKENSKYLLDEIEEEFGMEELEMEDLTEVSGGKKKGSDPAQKFQKLEAVWNELGFPTHGYTRHTLEAYCDEWESKGFAPSAKAFLRSKKNW